ncbi:hypothetical protein [Vibrio mangrovi]|uniref:Uncharacterized protein n=1 Tax=Vibrio mangrovi TaxID=474394 RepID=A0A1Y6IUR1_9VIBR|nr:hypothetical protein [Vibrio mangrovi]MDW6003125.1 hypothetical protein [Vibrio mangrovi]SMS01368.1 hypothetical protein VIM7927_02654 [Vibrio mangrovi]
MALNSLKTRLSRHIAGMGRNQFDTCRYKTHGLSVELEERIDNFCLFHEIVYQELNQKCSALNDFSAEIRKKLEETEDEDEQEYIKYQASQFIHSNDTDVQRVKNLADESAIIGLWSIVEQFSKRAYVLLKSNLSDMNESEISPPYQWPQIKTVYSEFGLELDSLPEYDTVNEVRVVNNKIKHLYQVDGQLAEFPRFTGKEGLSMIFLNYPINEYEEAVYMFLGHLLVWVGEKIHAHDTAVSAES